MIVPQLTDCSRSVYGDAKMRTLAFYCSISRIYCAAALQIFMTRNFNCFASLILLTVLFPLPVKDAPFKGDLKNSCLISKLLSQLFTAGFSNN
jgi:hypothetical protein